MKSRYRISIVLNGIVYWGDWVPEDQIADNATLLLKWALINHIAPNSEIIAEKKRLKEFIKSLFEKQLHNLEVDVENKLEQHPDQQTVITRLYDIQVAHAHQNKLPTIVSDYEFSNLIVRNRHKHNLASFRCTTFGN